MMRDKFIAVTAIVWLFRYPFRTAMMVAVGLTQIGEFSFVLLQVSRTSRLVSDAVYNATLTASLVTTSGRSAGFVGVLAIMVYLMFAAALYLLPPSGIT